VPLISRAPRSYRFENLKRNPGAPSNAPVDESEAATLLRRSSVSREKCSTTDLLIGSVGGSIDNSRRRRFTVAGTAVGTQVRVR